MDKQEAMLKLRESSWSYEDNSFKLVHIIDFDKAQEIVSKIYESRKGVIPRYVAEWIEVCRAKNFSLRFAMKHINLPDKVHKWLLETGPDGRTFPNQDIFARAWLDGYEVEKEKLYTVEIPNANEDEYVIVLERERGKIRINKSWTTSPIWKMEYSKRLTEEEIKEDFEWAWQFREEVD